MKDLTYITPDFAVAAWLEPEDLAEAARLGFKAVINNRPDGEAVDQPTADQMRRFATAAGLAYTHIPSNKLELFCDPVVDGMAEAIKTADAPILAHCQSGMRSAIVWAAASARERPVDDILAALDKAGFDLDFLRDELDQQAHKPRAIATIPTDETKVKSGPVSTWDAVRGAVSRFMKPQPAPVCEVPAAVPPRTTD